jgi:hypothetical protein
VSTYVHPTLGPTGSEPTTINLGGRGGTSLGAPGEPGHSVGGGAGGAGGAGGSVVTDAVAYPHLPPVTDAIAYSHLRAALSDQGGSGLDSTFTRECLRHLLDRTNAYINLMDTAEEVLRFFGDDYKGIMDRLSDALEKAGRPQG